MVRFSLNIKTCCLYVIWEKQDQIWAKFFCIPKNMDSRTSMKERTMAEDQLRTFLLEVEAIMNSRPLTPITLEVDSELPLTPNHFLRPNAVAGLPPIITSMKDDHPRQGWCYVQTAADYFWKRFSKEYLWTILPRHKWHDTKNNSMTSC